MCIDHYIPSHIFCSVCLSEVGSVNVYVGVSKGVDALQTHYIAYFRAQTTTERVES